MQLSSGNGGMTMQLLEDVYSGYLTTVASGEPASPARATPDIAAIWKGVPERFRVMLASAGHNPKEYKVYGGIGQVPFNWAKIPWVAICRRSITDSTTRGYYIVLLFRQDMAGCYLSLNQGFTQYKQAYGAQKIAEKQIARCAAVCADYLGARAPFIIGPIDLAATHAMGKGYERGAIASRYFPRTPAVNEMEFEAAFTDLMEMYQRLDDRVGDNILTFMPPVSEQIFQAEAGIIAVAEDQPELPGGPLDAPIALSGGMSGRYRRDPKIAARALRAANFKCEANMLHETFVSRRSSKPFVEAHHLFPMSTQSLFQYSLDVPENIIALCPNCHRLLHHGTTGAARPVLQKFHEARLAGLSQRGIDGALSQLFTAYRDPLDEDD